MPPFAPVGNFFFSIIQFIDLIVVPLIFSLAFLAFLWGVFRFFIAGGADKEKREEGRKFVMWGIIGFVIMFSLWGIVNLLVNSLGFDNNSRPGLPLFGSQAGGYGQYQGGGNGQNTGTVINGQTGPSCSLWSLPPFICPHGLDCRQGVCINIDGE